MSIMQKAAKLFQSEEDKMLDRPIPPALKSAHVTQLLHQHPFHPYDPDLPPGHPCTPQNADFYRCMSSRAEEEPLHMKHVNCFDPHKVALMKCKAAEKRREKLAAAGSTDSSAS